MFTNIRN